MVIFGMNKGMNCGSELDIIRVLMQEIHDTDFVWTVMDDKICKTFLNLMLKVRLSFSSSRIINPFLQFFATLEKRQFLWSHLNFFTWFWIPGRIGIIFLDKKGT